MRQADIHAANAHVAGGQPDQQLTRSLPRETLRAAAVLTISAGVMIGLSWGVLTAAGEWVRNATEASASEAETAPAFAIGFAD